MRLILLIGLFACAVENAFGFAIVSSVCQNPSNIRTSLGMTILTYNGKKKDFKAGSPLSVAVKQLGVPVKYSCKK
jgi:hypothetical protein